MGYTVERPAQHANGVAGVGLNRHRFVEQGTHKGAMMSFLKLRTKLLNSVRAD